MSRNYEINSPGNFAADRPQVTSYDASNEHSIEHCIDVQRMVEKSQEEKPLIAKPPKEP